MRRTCPLAYALMLSVCLVGPAVASEQATDQQPAQPIETVQSPVAAELLRRLAETGPRAAVRDAGQRAALTAFYAARANEPFWIGAEGLTPGARRAIAEIEKADDWGLSAADFALPAAFPANQGASPSPADMVEAELKLSVAVLEYARHARGGRMDPTDLSFAIDRTPPLIEPKRIIEEIARADQPDAYLRKLHPQHPQFERLRQLYLAMRAGTPPAEPAAADEPASGKSKAKAKSSRPEPGSARRVLLNMEQWRWMPESLGELYVWVNIPEFMVRVVRNGQVIHSERVITGTVENKTPIFSDEMETVVFHPSWGVPNSIKVKELLPSLLRGGDILARHGLRAEYRGQPVDPLAIDWTATDIRNLHIYQPPGQDNVLGVVKFLFPNKHDVYMHDTPTRNLFNSEVRAFSHGCMRVRDPVRLAELVMGHANGWSAEQVAKEIRSGPQNNNVSLSKRIPVHVTYFTAAVDDAGKAQFWRDIYGHEQRIQMGLEGKAHLIAKKKEDLGPIRAGIVSRYAYTQPFSFGFGSSSNSGRTPDWARRAFNN
jgi:murein L,D-transpeptidase YcbB/YkuD